jgi:DNA-directed RNA polymerase subunit D
LKIANYSEKKGKASFEILDGDIKLANTLRRYLISGVPVYAIDKITVYENSASFFDEYIAHRIGMIPLTTPEADIDPEKIGFYLDFAGPGTVHSKDIKSNSEAVKVAVNDIPIVRLLEGQVLRIECRAKKDIGRTHAKFQSGIASYSVDEKGIIHFWVENMHHMETSELIRRAFKKMDADFKSLSEAIKEAK